MVTHTESVVISGISGSFGAAASPRALWKSFLRRQQFFVPFGEMDDAHFTNDFFPEHTMPKVCAALGANFACRADRVPLPPDLGIGDNPDFYFMQGLISDALVDAGLPPHQPSTDRMALFIGYEPLFNPASINWLQHASGIEQLMSAIQRFVPAASYASLDALRNELAETLPLLKSRQIDQASGDGFVRLLAQAFGACDTACLCQAGEASIFAGLDAAMNSLQMHQCDVAIVAALQPPIPQSQLAGLAVLTPFSEASELHPFTDGTSGTLPGEGGAAFVLRRLSDVQKAGDHAYAKVHGCALVSGISPESEGGLVESLRRALHRSLRRLPNGFRDVDYWEMNGSGIASEDAAEEEILNRMTANRGAHIPLLALGSAKTTVGNTFTAAGAAGLLKGVLALQHCILPPSAMPVDESFHLRVPEQAYYWVQEARPWIASSMRPRRVAVSTISHLGRSGAAILEALS